MGYLVSVIPDDGAWGVLIRAGLHNASVYVQNFGTSVRSLLPLFWNSLTNGRTDKGPNERRLLLRGRVRKSKGRQIE
eukprot:4174003-Amphidinium_carterae.1